jgi:hypothetical protein
VVVDSPVVGVVSVEEELPAAGKNNPK